jgi:hypothetical protein
MRVQVWLISILLCLGTFESTLAQPNKNGVLEYDGVEWRRIPVPGDPPVRSLATAEDGVVFVGAFSEFGYLAPDRTGQMHYLSLSDTIDLNKGEFQYSGAYNPLYLVRKLKPGEKQKLARGEELELPRGSIHDNKYLLLQIRADPMPIGISEKTGPFSASTFKDEGYSIYMFSDGFLDQFGGPRKKKFMSKNFKRLILELQSIDLKDQGAALDKVLAGWMGDVSQIDDILVMGLRLKEH